jgi:predicted  nucleic acid-binding Zn-ribbon protein
MIADVLSAIDEIYIQEAESEFNSCLEIINEYDKIFKTRDNISINTNNIEQFFQENAWSDDVKKQNRGKSTLNKILFTIPRMIISLFRLITGKLKKNKLPDKSQAQHLEQQIAHINPKKIKVSKSGSAANIIAIVGGSLTLGAAGALTYLGFRKATSSATTNATPEDIDHERPVAVIESTDTDDEKSDEKSNEEVNKLNEEIAKLNERLKQANTDSSDKDEQIAKLEKEKKDLNDRLELVRNNLARSQGERDQAKRESDDAKKELENLKIEVKRKISPEVVSERLSGLYGEMINIFKECLNMAKKQSSPEERQAIIDKFNELQNRLKVTQSESDKEKVRLSITEVCESTNNNISELQKKIGEINELKKQADELNKTIEENNKTIAGLEKKLEKANKDLESAKNRNRETRKTNFGKFKQNFKNALSSMPSSIKELENIKKGISESIDSLNVQKQQLESQVNELDKKSGELSSEISQKTAEKQNLDNSITAKRTNVENLEDQIKQNQNELNKIKSEIDDQKKEQATQDKELEKIREELTKLESSIKAKQAELAKAEEQAKTNNARLSSENEQLRKDLAKYVAAYEAARKTIESYKIAEEERRKTFNTELNKTQYQITTVQDARSDEPESSVNEDIVRTAAKAIESLGQAMTEDVQAINDIQIITNELQSQTTGSEYIHDSQEKPDPTKLSNDELVEYIRNTDNDSSQEDQSTENDESTSNEETQTTDNDTVQSDASDKPETNEDKSEEVQPLHEDDNKLDISGIINDNTYSARDLFTNVEKWRTEEDKDYWTYNYLDKVFSYTDNSDANYIGVPLDKYHFLIYPNKTESFDVKGTMSYVFKCAGINNVKDNDTIKPCLADSDGKIVQNGEFIKAEENASSDTGTQENQRQDEQQQTVSKLTNVEQPAVSSNNVRNENRVTTNEKQQQKAVDNTQSDYSKKRSIVQGFKDSVRNLFSGEKQQERPNNLADAVNQYTNAANNVSNQIDAAQNKASAISSSVQNISRSANEDDE